MNTEQLKMILDALQSMGVTGQSAFIWWLVIDKLVPSLVALFAISCAAFLLIRVVSLHSANSYLAALRDRMGIGSPGPLYQSEFDEVRKRVETLMEKQ